MIQRKLTLIFLYFSISLNIYFSYSYLCFCISLCFFVFFVAKINMNLENFDYTLPDECIAYHPVSPRDHSRLLVLKRDSGELKHNYFYDLANYLTSNDLLVVNNTKVIPARLLGEKISGAKVEIFLLRELEPNVWETLVKPGRRLQIGAKIIFGNNELKAEIIGLSKQGKRIVQFHIEDKEKNLLQIIEKLGQMPLPPYISRPLEEEDKETYQTVYANTSGSVAAPTAGLHFTPELLEKLKAKGVEIATILLHVGLGTFRPVKTEDITKHEMESEYYEISSQTATLINKALIEKKRIIAVGTTSVRTLETIAEHIKGKGISMTSGWTKKFIYPSYDFQLVDALITNFHLPKSTLLMLVSAFAGREKVLNAYKVAIEKGYRFYSYGDAMFVY